MQRLLRLQKQFQLSTVELIQPESSRQNIQKQSDKKRFKMDSSSSEEDKKHCKMDSSSSEEEEEEEEEVVSTQTFPQQHVQTVIRQSEDDLTCGMRCMQNLYGETFITREEMDICAQKLEKKSYGDAMYDPKLGFYSIEVIHAILKQKNKCVQRIDVENIPSEYFIPAVNLNTNFIGYIVAIGSGNERHYIAIRYNSKQKRFRRLDSLPGIRPIDISQDTLFKRRQNGQLYCSMEQNEKHVTAVIAIGHSGFLEYNLLKDTWEGGHCSAADHINNIRHILQGNKRVVLNRLEKLPESTRTGVRQWYKTWPVEVFASKGENVNRRRIMPSENCYEFLKLFLKEGLTPFTNIIVKMNKPNSQEQIQTIIRCSNVGGFIRELKHMNWINNKSDFWMSREDKTTLQDEFGDELNIESSGSFESYNIDPEIPIIIYLDNNATMASVGGFYSFQYKVEGTCIGQQHNAYSIRDKDGLVHILYKSSISSIETK